jgi:hypothetical protein
MTQDSDRRSSSSNRRSARSGRNRPVLVTSTTNEENQQANLEETTPTLEESLSEVQEQNPSVAPTSPTSRRLPNFFSTIGRRGQAEASSETDAAQARLARATRGKVAPTTKAPDNAKSEQKPEVKKAPSTNKASTPARPATGFKTRYLIGMGLYLLGANFIGALETSFFQANHIDSVLARFNLFGALITVSTSTLAFLATLIILLVVLARLDLIPRNFAAMSGQSSQANRRGTSSSSNKNQNTSENARNMPPTMRQGVKGADDDLYQEYRANQRREKKK